MDKTEPGILRENRSPAIFSFKVIFNIFSGHLIKSCRVKDFT